jgi:hypothetical protein
LGVFFKGKNACYEAKSTTYSPNTVLVELEGESTIYSPNTVLVELEGESTIYSPNTVLVELEGKTLFFQFLSSYLAGNYNMTYLLTSSAFFIYNNNNNHGSTALYGLGPPLSEVTWSAHLWQFGDQPTGRAVQLNPDVTARAIWQGEKWPLEFRL